MMNLANLQHLFSTLEPIEHRDWELMNGRGVSGRYGPGDISGRNRDYSYALTFEGSKYVIFYSSIRSSWQFRNLTDVINYSTFETFQTIFKFPVECDLP